MLVSASITPHPPIIVPGIGQPADLQIVEKTTQAMEELSKKIAQARPDTLIIISPHAMIHSDRMAVYASPRFYGDFGQFGSPQISFRFNNDLGLAQEIVKKSDEAGINAFLFGDPDSDYFELDHGEMVPLYYLMKNLPKDIRILPIAYSYLDKLQHFGFGQVIQKIANHKSQIGNRIALIASGDLSHRLIQGAPAGYSEAGKEFDQQIVEFISQNKVRDIIEMDEEFVEDAGECGYRSILILLGTLDGLKYKPEILSYEGPFGVGYLVANFPLDNR